MSSYTFAVGTAGSLVSSKVPMVTTETTVKEALSKLRAEGNSFDSISYLYVLEEQSLVGIVPLTALMSASNLATLETVMTQPVISIRATASQDELLHLALTKKLKSVPVVHNNQFVGAVLAHTLLQTLRTTYADDRYKSAGLDLSAHDAYQDLSFFRRVRSRIPWLLMGLLGGIVAALVVDLFENTIQQELLLVAFIPAIVNISDAIGNQTEMLFIRWSGNTHRDGFLSYLKRELVVGTAIGVLIGIVIYFGTYYWIGNLTLSYILGFSILATTYLSILITILLPWFFEKINIDPAVASGPIATVLCDISSLAVYLTIAAIWL